MSFLIVLAALAFLMLAAYRGYSVIRFAPIAALGAVLLTDPSAVAPVFSGIFREKMVGLVKLCLPAFMPGAVFGKLIELSGFSGSIVAAVMKYIGRSRANAVIVAVCALLSYGGVSLFVVVLAVYPFAAELCRQSNIPKRLIPGALALGAFSFTMDSLPGTPQIQNIIPTTFFQTTSWAAPILGTIGSVVMILVGLACLEWRRRAAMAAGEGYGTALVNEPDRAKATVLQGDLGRHHHQDAGGVLRDRGVLPDRAGVSAAGRKCASDRPGRFVAPAAMAAHRQDCLHRLNSRLS